MTPGLAKHKWNILHTPSPRQFKVQASAGKIMCTLFWYAEGIQLFDFIPHRLTTITGVYYADLLRKLLVAVKRSAKESDSATPTLHDSAPAHISHVGQAAVLKCEFEEMCHPPYSPDQTPNNYHLFPNLKKHLHGQTEIFDR